ncbi:MAG TPA: acyltransferase family protein [Acidimicrobiales bacterium]
MEQLTQEGAPARLAAAARTRSGDLDAPARPRRSVHADGDRWRLDIQGLRGVAILAVVIYHADPTLLPGGFIGVDLFFVISGFLITGLLMRELEERGTVSLRRFYARRIRRLLPMAFIVIAATVIAADLLQSPLDATRTAKDALSSALFVANYRFALEQTNYLYSGVGLSPFQHFWSLGVEEQMYLIWPMLLLVGAKVWQKGRTYTRGAFAILFVGSAVSFLACLRLTNSNEPWAFFSFPTRAWELGVGGLVALAAPSLRTLPRGASSLLGLAGIAAVAWAAADFGASTPWPGGAAAIPVLGAAAIIAAGCSKGMPLPARLLAFPGLQFAGRISYPWYLWHWPVLVLAPLVLKHSLDPAQALLLVVASGALATASHFLVERPVHVSTWLAQRSRRGLALGFSLTAGAVALCTSSVTALALPSISVVTPTLGHPPIVVAAQSSQATNPEVAALASSTAEVQTDLVESQALQNVPADLTPSLAGAFSDIPILYADGCVDTYTSIALNHCVYGDTTSSTSVVLFGDSHAAMWFPAVDQAAERFSWKLYAWSKDTCPPLVVPVISPDLGRAYSECTTWRNEVLQEIAEIHPALVILGVARHYSPIYGFSVYSPQWMDGLSQMISQIRALGSQVLVMGPVPKPTFTVAGCLSENLANAQNCASARDSAVDIKGMRQEENTVVSAGGTYVNTLFWFCSAQSTCPPIVDGVLVYRDDNHITATYASFLTTPVEAALDLAEQGIPDPNSAVYLGPNST